MRFHIRISELFKKDYLRVNWVSTHRAFCFRKMLRARSDGEDIIEGKSEQVISDYSATSGQRSLSPSDQEVSCKTFADQDLGNIQNLAKNGSVMSETSSGSSKSKKKM